MRTTGVVLVAALVGVLLGGSSTAATHRPAAPLGTMSTTLHQSLHSYVALGDSYTAGSGIPPVATTGCQRSGRNYPTILARRLSLKLADASCGGAVTESANQPQATGAGLAPNPPQLAQVGPGTDLVTISLGVNDSGFANVLYECLAVAAWDPTGSPCQRAFTGVMGDDAVSTSVAAMQTGLSQVIGQARARAPQARLVVIGYPQMVPPTGTCAELPFATGDYAYVGRFFETVDSAEAAAARAAGATYVDLLAASRGHSACDGDQAWVDGWQSNAQAMAFHPYLREEKAVAELVERALARSARHAHH